MQLLGPTFVVVAVNVFVVAMLVVTDHIMFSCGWDCLHSLCQTQLQCLRLCCGCTLLFLGL